MKRLLSFFEPDMTVLVLPNECLILEDKCDRDWMRDFWVPHLDVAVECKTKQKDMLTGRTVMIKVADDRQLGQLDDGWAESIPYLEHFDYKRYAIDVPS
ncbi:hypothetical protein PAAG_00615 [Paracoccidioides lutzii Pb01]|uniref:Uncharacterized protein n=1 Tax=Paracoccidioides lutzii (strain ATCC MYA-826 / Pb01) TaxID=502779 RepID=C1GQ20_PARBA|nr:hypothetical protein PAAG_00615 [Paracoccidioides lutzii Pb01]EEH36292.2 hypothetical protein PAAG_00615 [Paracoccidioides lutzii Pb01]